MSRVERVTEAVRAQKRPFKPSVQVDRLESILDELRTISVLMSLNNRSSPYLWSEYDRLFLLSRNSVSPATNGIFVLARVLLNNGEVIQLILPHTPNTDRTVASSFFRLPQDSWLLNLAVVTNGINPVIGQTYVQIGVAIRGTTSADVGAIFIQDYLYDSHSPNWPPIGSGLVDLNLSQNGFLRSFAGTNPAAGSEWSETVPTDARWNILGANAQLVTDATVAQRRVTLIIDDGTNILTQKSYPTGQTASQTRTYNWGPWVDADPGIANLFDASWYAKIPLFAAYRIRTVTTNIVAGDDWGAPRIYLEEFLED